MLIGASILLESTHVFYSFLTIGGGISNVSKILVQPSYETCYSDYQWRSITPIESGQTRNSTFVTCTDFLEADLEPDINMCLAYGNLIGGNEHNATKSCCECRYGYESNGGGYRGVLTGAFMRFVLNFYQFIFIRILIFYLFLELVLRVSIITCPMDIQSLRMDYLPDQFTSFSQ